MVEAGKGDLVAEHYTQGDLLAAIRAALAWMNKTTDDLTIEDLAPVDEFHIGGREASEHFLAQLKIDERHRVLDIGCGLGGASRFIAQRYQAQVTGIDLTDEFVATGKVLSAWVGLDRQVALYQGSALEMPFEAQTFDRAFMMHVGMNVEQKPGLFAEVWRVLRPGAVFGVYDVMRTGEGELDYPVPWAAAAEACRVASPDDYVQALSDAGFDVAARHDRRDFALVFFRELSARLETSGGPPPLGLHTLIGDSAPLKFANMIDNIRAGRIAPVEMIAHKA